MKKLMNFTTTSDDINRYTSHADFAGTYGGLGLDGVELLVLDEGDDIVLPADVVGAHLIFFSYWVCLWNGDEAQLLGEYYNYDICRDIFGGTNKQALIDAFGKNLAASLRYSPEYNVFHVSDISIQASITHRFEYTDEQVIDATIELVNEVYTNESMDGSLLLFENLWWPGMDMRRPDMVHKLLDGVRYGHTGVMLDIGHLLHTNPAIRDLDEGIDYVYSVLDKYKNLDFIKGIHLHQTLSGQYVQSVLDEPITLPDDFQQRQWAIYKHIMKIDGHQPFVSGRLDALINHINPDYLVLEFISANRAEHEGMLRRQLECLEKPVDTGKSQGL